MFLRVSIAVILLSVYGVLGASVSVNGTDAKNVTSMDNSTKSLNASENILKIRALDDNLKVLNVSDVKSLNSTLNSSKAEREVGEMVEVLLLGEENNSTNNSSESSEHKVERATVEVIAAGNETLRLNSTEGNNQTTRSVNSTSDANSTSAGNSTANPWSALPLFRNLNATLANSSASTNSSRRQAVIIAKNNSTEEDAGDDSTVDETTDKTSTLKVDESETDGLDEEMMDEEGISTKKPCTTVSCLISRGCSDTSCTPDN